MISMLRGAVLEKRPPFAVIDAGGVGYEVEMPMNSFYSLPEVASKDVTLYIHEIIREDAFLLYGFMSASERSLFREILKVNSVGPKTALVVMSNLTPQELVAIVSAGDAASLAKLPTIGKKSAERLIVELRDRLEKWAADPDNASLVRQTSGEGGAKPAQAENSSVRRTAVAAMLQLGYNQKQAEDYVAAAYSEEKTVEQLIKDALQMTLGGKRK
ncbi:MAG: Holliday junction branch migration protein RuvA [Succinivibrionaceae bacterium]|nr:Holliday junction branch migration protein RuvA [Succinivibrionaceae bacterium]